MRTCEMNDVIGSTIFTKLHWSSPQKKHFKLIDTLGNVVRERTRKVKPEQQNFISFRKTDLYIYVLVNRFFTKSICFAIDQQGDLVYSSDTVYVTVSCDVVASVLLDFKMPVVVN